jgi:hypothetical protein
MAFEEGFGCGELHGCPHLPRLQDVITMKAIMYMFKNV